MQTSFIPTLDALPARKSPLMERFAALLEPKAPAQIEAMARESQIITRRNFGKTMRLFAPLYVSNECVNNCSYCGFSRDNNAILRVTLTVDQVIAEAKHLVEQGFRNILLVAGEHPRFVSEGYLEECIRALRDLVPTIGIEVGPMEAPEYERMVKAGAEGLVVYQETY
ncbi:radical SAM protein, partial [Prosthecobacter sp.]|uniref:radical SAM protein n=1 Tax=Prosthecobacter sp. TaxID=1965333 RepID=UPI001D93C279|nr:2-iminoacetate synthase ThiH [Prosthecobacter sp.]